MKKVFRLAAIATVAMAMTTACNNAPEAVEDTIPIEDTIVEEVIDTIVEEEVEAPAPAPAKKAVKKEEAPKTNVEIAAQGKKGITVSNGKTNLSVSEDGVKLDSKQQADAPQPKSKKISVQVNN